MTPAARVEAAIHVLDEILDGTPTEKALTNWARRSRFAGSKDRAAVRDHVFQALRCRRSYAVLGGALSGRGLMIGALRAGQQPLDQIFSGERYAPAALSPEEQIAGKLSDVDRLDLPDWLITEFRASLGSDLTEVATALRRRAPIVLRVNRTKSNVSAVQNSLAASGIIAVPHEISPTALIVKEGERRLANSPLYLDGTIELQDGSSQSAMEQINIPDGAQVLDFCAGGGGKTLAMAARGSAEWYAHDANPQRMKDLHVRANRAGVKVEILSHDVLSHRAPYDIVLCDVPCSGSGTWRRTPAAKWNLTQQDLTSLVALQGRILKEASFLVSKTGTLAYATCSVLSRENEDQISTFLRSNPNWRCILMRRWKVSDGGDGFFLSILERENG